MFDVIARLRGRLRHGLATQEILDVLARRGIVLYPYIVFEEPVNARLAHSPLPPDLTMRRLTRDDVPAIAGISARPHDAEAIRNRLREGNIGVGAFEGDKLVAWTWCGLDYFRGVGQRSPRRSLTNEEAYLFDAYTLPAYRGRSLVPRLRTEMYKILEAEGRRRAYSVSLLFNRSARRFKAKLGATAVELRLSINLFEIFRRDLRLRRYPAAARPC